MENGLTLAKTNRGLVILIRICSLIVITGSMITLIGWIFGIPVLFQVKSQFKPIAISSIACFLLIGTALYSSTLSPESRLVKQYARMASLIVFCEACAVLMHRSLNHDLDFMGILFGGQVPLAYTDLSLMSQTGAICFLLLSISYSVLLWDLKPRKQWQTLSTLLAAALMGLSLIILMNAVISNPHLYGKELAWPVSIPAGLMHFFSALCICALPTPESCLSRIFSGDSVRARLMRVYPLLAVVSIFCLMLVHNGMAFLNIGDPIVEVSIASTGGLFVALILGGFLSDRIGGEIDKIAEGRRIVEEELRVSELKYRMLFENLTVAFVVCELINDGRGDPIDLRVLEANAVFAKYAGLPLNQIIGRSIGEVMSYLDRKLIDQYIGVILEGEPVAYEHFVAASGKYYECWAFSPGPDQVAVVCADITERILTQQLIQQEGERAAVLMELYEKSPGFSDIELYDFALDKAVSLTQSEIGFLHLVDDEQANVILTTWNEEALKNCSAAEAGAHYSIEAAGNWIDCVKMRGPLIYNNYPDSPNQKGLPEGHVPLTRFMSIPVITDGLVRIILGVGNKRSDYTEQDIRHLQLTANELHRIMIQRRLMGELAQRVRELARSNEDLEQFAYVASHDLQEPLRMVASYTQLLGLRYKGRLDNDADDFINFAVDGVYRMQMLINDLLAYSRVETRGKDFEKISVEEVLDRVLINLNLIIDEQGAIITRDPLPVLMADGQQLVQLFQNLLANAIKFHGPNPPEIHISVQMEDSEWVFAVNDNGIGIEAIHFERIFNIFNRLHTKEEYPGTGIGLAVCKKIVARHGGRIWVESEVGRGATFYFTIPYQLAPGQGGGVNDGTT